MCPYKQQIFNQLSNIHCRDALNKSVRDCEIKKQLYLRLKAQWFISLGQRPRKASPNQKRSVGAKSFIDCAWRELPQRLMAVRSIPQLFATDPKDSLQNIDKVSLVLN